MSSTETTEHGVIPEGKCICTTCNVEKDNCEFQFYKNRINPGTGFRLRTNRKCKSCTRDYSTHKKIAEQQAPPRPVPSTDNPVKCNCCEKDIITTRTLQLDHDHSTGNFRGWLCKECNISLGNIGDNVQGMLRAAAYLNKTENLAREQVIERIDALFGF